MDNEFENPWRIPALIIEGLPVLIGLLGILFNSPSMITIGFCTLAILYVVGSWYIFKAEKFKALDIIIAIVFGITFSVLILGLLFHIQNWEGYDLMMTVNITTIILMLPIALVLFLLRRKSPFEFTFSKKILVRMIIYSLLSVLLYDKWDLFTSS